MQRGQCFFVFLKCKMFRRLVIPDSSSSEGEGVSPITVRAAVHNESTTTLTLDELSQETQRIEDARKITEEVEKTAITRTFEEIVDIGEESETQIIGTHRDNATLHQGKTSSIEREELSISKQLETFPEKSKPNSLKPQKSRQNATVVEEEIFDISDEPHSERKSSVRDNNTLVESKTSATDWEELFLTKKLEIDFIADASIYSKFKKKASERTKPQNLTNIIATVNKVNEKTNQKSFQKVVYPFYNDLKQRGFPVEEIEELIKKATKVIKSEQSKGIKTFFYPINKKEISTVAPSPQEDISNFQHSAPNPDCSTSRDIIKQSPESTSKKMITDLLYQVLAEGKSINDFNLVNNISLDVSSVPEVTERIRKFQTEMMEFKSCQVRRQKNSVFKRSVDSAESRVITLRRLFQNYQTITNDGIKKSEAAESLAEKAVVIGDSLKRSKAVEKQIQDEVLRIKFDNVIQMPPNF